MNTEEMREFINRSGGIYALKYFLRGEEGNVFYQLGFRLLPDSGAFKDEYGYRSMVYRWSYENNFYELEVQSDSWESIDWYEELTYDITQVKEVEKTIKVWEKC